MRRLFLTSLALAALLCPGPAWADARSEYLEAVEHQKAQRWAEAAQAYARVTALAPAYAPAWKQLSSCRYYLGDLEGAEASAQRYLKLQPGDASFVAWNAKLREKLKLPPLDLAGPAPTPVPTLVPEEGVITAAPAPSADAELAVPAATLSAPAAEGAAPAQGSQSFQAAVIDESAAAQPSAPQSAWGLRVAGSFSLGFGGFKHGEQVNSSTTPSNNSYPGQAGLGPGGLFEVLHGRGPRLEFSLGAYPISWKETQRSSRTDSVTRSDESTAGALILPLLLGAGARLPLSPEVNAVLSLGLGVVPSAHVDVTEETVQTTAGGLSNTRIKASVDYGLAPAWRLGGGVEVPLGRRSAFFLGAQLLGAQFSDTKGKYDYEVVDESGNVVSSGKDQSTKAQALSVLSASALAGLSFRF